MHWYFDVLRKYATFSGRAPRSEYWWFVLINFLIALALALVDHSRMLLRLYMLAMIIPFIALHARRLHDTDRSGWWQLIGVIPVIGWIILLFFYVSPGTPGTNSYGSVS